MSDIQSGIQPETSVPSGELAGVRDSSSPQIVQRFTSEALGNAEAKDHLDLLEPVDGSLAHNL
jgi:hypothetical protein